MRRVLTSAMAVVLASAGVAVAVPTPAAPLMTVTAAGKFSYYKTWDRYSAPMLGPFKFAGTFAAGTKSHTSNHYRGSLTPLDASESYPMRLTIYGGFVDGTCTASDTSVDANLPELTLDCRIRNGGPYLHTFLVLDGTIADHTGDGVHDPVFERITGTFRSQ
jgi:hypothetical protein